MLPTNPNQELPKLRRNPFEIQWSVVHALFIRNLKSQFGKMRGGILWAFVEPLSQVAFFTGMFYLRGMKDMDNIPIPMLVITGICPFLLFNHIYSGSSPAFRKTTSLFHYRVVQPIDPVLANALHHTAFYVFMLGTFIFFFCYILQIHYEQILLLKLMIDLLLLVMLSLGLGLIFTVSLTFTPEIAKLLPFITRPLFFLSGVFFSADSLPATVRPYFLLNPLLHIIEINRSCFYYSYPSHGDLGYVAICASVTLFVGMLTMRYHRRELMEQ